MSDSNAVATVPAETNHIRSVRQHLIDQMRALRDADKPEKVKLEIERSKGMADLAQAIVNSAKVEVDYLKATKQSSTPFLEVPPDQPYIGAGGGQHVAQQLSAPGDGITAITRYHLKG